MFSSVHRCTGDLTCEVLILTCFGDLPPDRQLYLGMGTMIVKETIRSWGHVSGEGRVGVGRDVSAWGDTYGRVERCVDIWAHLSAHGGATPIRPNADTCSPIRVSCPDAQFSVYFTRCLASSDFPIGSNRF